jgi:hypothetical protein
MGFWGSGRGPENGWWSFDDTVDDGGMTEAEFAREQKARKAKKAEKRRAVHDDDDDTSSHDDDDDTSSSTGLSDEGATALGHMMMWMVGIGVVISFWYIALPIAILWLIGTLANEDDG